MRNFLSIALAVLGAQAAMAGNPHEDFSIAVDRDKGRIYALYVQALKANPGLKGKIVYDIDIAKTGDVTGCRVRSSTMNLPSLEAKICMVMLAIKISPQAAATRITKPMDFFPTS